MCTDPSGHLEALLKWNNLPAFEATREEFEASAARFPSFNLEDKVHLWEEGIAIHNIGQAKPLVIYNRRRQKGKTVNAAGDDAKET